MTITAQTTTHTFDLLHRAYECLAGVCDFASTQDGRGFNGGDAKFGHEVAQHPLSHWTPEITRTAWEVAVKYQAQIEGFGIEWQSIPEPAKPADPDYRKIAFEQRRHLKEARVSKSSRVIRLMSGGGAVALSFSYNANLVSEVKSLPSRKWNGDARLWEASLTASGNAAAVFEFARRNDFVIEDEAQSALQVALDAASTLPEPVLPAGRQIRLSPDGTALEFWFPNEASVRDAVKTLSGRRFDPDGPCWRVPVDASQSAAVMAVALDYGFAFSETAQAALDAAREATAQALADSRAEDADFDVEGLGGTLRTFQRAGVKYLHTHRRCFLADDMGTGKAQPLDAPILTPSGWKSMGEMLEGQEVINSQGGTSIVTGVFPQGEKMIFSVLFSDGSTVECCDDHLWHVHSAVQKKRGTEAKVIPLSTIRTRLRDGSGNCRYYVPIVQPVCFAAGETLPIHPYVLGALIGGGGITSRVILTTADEELAARLSAFLPEGVHLNRFDKYGYRIASEGANKPNIIMNALRDMDLMGRKSDTKFLPDAYKFTTVANRVEMLQGLMDTDGTVSKNGTNVVFYTVSDRLSDDVIFLVQSLGGIARHKIKKTGFQDCHVLHISLPASIQPFSLERKAARYKGRTKYLPCRAIVSVKQVGVKQAQCISVDAPDRLYVTSGCILTHNTLQSLAAFKANGGKKCLVICPASVKLNWVKEVYTFLPGCTATVISGKGGAPLSVRVKGEARAVSTNDLSASVVIVNYDILTKNLPALMAAGFDHLIVDESHYCKDNKAARTAAVTQIATGMQKDKATKKRVRVAEAVPNVYLLSGTPLLNRPIELVPQLEALDLLDRFGGFMAFAKRYCGAHQTGFGWDMSGANNMGELNEKLRTFGYIRRTKSQVLKELPPKQRITVPVEIDNRKEYNAAETDLIAYLVDAVAKDKAFFASLGGMTKDDRDKAITARQNDVAHKASAAEHLVKINTLKQIAVRGKMDGIKEWVRDFLATGEKLVIFGWYRETVESLAKEFSAPTIMGGDTAVARQAAVERFQSDPECRVIVCNIIAAGEGITLTAASTTLFVELGWNPGKMNQAEDRVHRIGQHAESVTAYYLLGQNTIEEKVAELIESKRVVTDAGIEGEAGAAAAESGILKDIVNYLIEK